MLHDIVLQNFRQHSELYVGFDTGLTSIVGPNNAGKTGLLKAILFALGGAPATGSRAEDLWSWSAGASGNCYVALHLDMPGHGRVRVLRSQTSAKVWRGDDLLASGTRPVNSLVEDAFGMDLKSLRMLMYSPQGETQELVRMGGTELQRRVETLAQISVIDRVLDLLKGDINVWAGQLEILPTTEDLPELRAASGRTKELAVDLEKQGGEVSVLLDQAEVVAAEAARVRDAAVEAYTRKTNLSAHLSSVSEWINDHAGRLEEARADESAKLEALRECPSEEVALGAVGTAVAQVKGIGKEITESKIALAGYAERKKYLATMEKELPDHHAATAALEELRPRVREARQACDALRVERNTVLQAVKGMTKAVADSVCQACQRPYHDGESLETAKAKLAEQQAAASQLLAQLEEAESKLAHLEIEEGQLRQRLLNARTLAHIAQMQDQAQEMEVNHPIVLTPEKLSELESDYAVANSVLCQAEEALTRVKASFRAWVEAQQRTLTLEKSMGEARDAQEGLQEAISELGDVPDPAAAIAAADAARAEVATLGTKFSDLTHQLDAAWTNFEVMGRQISELEAAEAKRKEIEANTADAKALQAYLQKSRGRLSEDIWVNLLNFASSLIASATSGNVSKVERAADGSFIAYEGEVKVPVSELGGAYRSIVGLALRIALSHTFFGPNLPLLLDEPTADARDDTAAAIAGMLLSLGGQVISVTHRQGEAANAGSVIALGDAA